MNKVEAVRIISGLPDNRDLLRWSDVVSRVELRYFRKIEGSRKKLG